MKIIGKAPSPLKCRCSICRRNLNDSLEPLVCTCSICRRHASSFYELLPKYSSLSPSPSPLLSVNPTPSTSKSIPAILLPNEILTIIFDLARPNLPQSSSEPNQYYYEWKSYYSLSLVCQDWRECAKKEGTKALVIQSQAQFKRIVEAVEKKWIEGSDVKVVILDIKVIGEEVDEEIFYRLFQTCRFVEDFRTIGFGTQSLLDPHLVPVGNDFSQLRSFVYIPIDEADSMNSGFLIRFLNHYGYGLVRLALSSSEVSEEEEDSTSNPLFFLISGYFEKFEFLRELVLKSFEVSAETFLHLLVQHPPTVITLELLDLKLSGILHPSRAVEIFEEISNLTVVSNLQSFIFSVNELYTSGVPPDLFWFIVKSYKQLTFLSILDSDIFLNHPSTLTFSPLWRDFQIGCYSHVSLSEVMIWVEEHLSRSLRMKIMLENGYLDEKESKEVLNFARSRGLNLALQNLIIVETEVVEETLYLRESMLNNGPV